MSLKWSSCPPLSPPKDWWDLRRNNIGAETGFCFWVTYCFIFKIGEPSILWGTDAVYMIQSQRPHCEVYSSCKFTCVTFACLSTYLMIACWACLPPCYVHFSQSFLPLIYDLIHALKFKLIRPPPPLLPPPPEKRRFLASFYVWVSLFVCLFVRFSAVWFCFIVEFSVRSCVLSPHSLSGRPVACMAFIGGP